MKFPLLNIDGSKSETIEVSDKIVKLKINHKLIKFVIDWQLNHAKPRTAKTKIALAQTLSKKTYDKNLHILADVKKEIKKTKEFNKFLEKNNLNNVLIISDTDTLKNINKSARNIKNVKLIEEIGTNIYDMIKYRNVIITSSSFKKIQNRILNEKN